MALVAFPLPNITDSASVSWFRVSPPSPRENALRVLYYIGVF
jgi:hypothetical protein